MTRSRSPRLVLAAIAFIAILTATLFDVREARAECCGFGIYNYTQCSFRVNLVTASVDTLFVVPPGGGSWTIPDCAPFRLSVRDACGVEHHLPTVIGQCITIYLGPGCCVKICKITECRWETTYDTCTQCL